MWLSAILRNSFSVISFTVYAGQCCGVDALTAEDLKEISLATLALLHRMYFCRNGCLPDHPRLGVITVEFGAHFFVNHKQVFFLFFFSPVKPLSKQIQPSRHLLKTITAGD